MKPISTLLKIPEKSKPTSERAEGLRPFVERLRDKKGKPYRPAFIAMKLSHVPTSELYYLLKQCEQARSFGAMFWYLIKPKS